MNPQVPIYCETAHPWLGMAEPVNTITNAAIILAAYFAYRYVNKSKVGFSGDLVLLIFLLAACGIGSTLWHGLRTWWALQLDWIPGVCIWSCSRPCGSGSCSAGPSAFLRRPA